MTQIGTVATDTARASVSLLLSRGPDSQKPLVVITRTGGAVPDIKLFVSSAQTFASLLRRASEEARDGSKRSVWNGSNTLRIQAISANRIEIREVIDDVPGTSMVLDLDQAELLIQLLERAVANCAWIEERIDGLKY